MASRTPVGLEAMLSCQLELLEHGLCVVAQNIELGEVASVAILGRDVRGAPVLVFTDDHNAAMPAAMRACRAHAHLVANPWLLQRLFPHRLPDVVASCLRVVVVAFHFDELALATLRALTLPDLLVLELNEWSVAGQRQWCARPMVVRPEREDRGFSPPSGTPSVCSPSVREFLSWVERLDADVTVEGDRYARRVYARGRLLCNLTVDMRTAEVCLADGTRSPLATRDDAIAAMERVMLAFRQQLRDGAPAAAEPPTANQASAPAGGLQLGDLRRAVADVRVTRAECSALQFGESES